MIKRFLTACGLVVVTAGAASAQVWTPSVNTPNPSAPGTVAFTMCFDGVTWDPCSTSGGGGGSFNGVLLDADFGDPVTDTANDAIRVNVVAGSASGTTDNDDASIAAGQTGLGLNASLAMAFDGTVWRRLTFGTAGTASTQVLTVQGIASMTPLLVNGSGVTQPVTGTVTADLGATDNAVLDAIAASVAGTLTVGSHAVTNAGTFSVQASSVVAGTGATNLGKAEDAAHGSGDTLVAVAAVRNDAGTALAGTTGDYIPFTTDSTGALRVTGGGGGTQFAEDAAHTTGDSGTLSLAVRNDAGTALAGTTGDYIPLTTDSSGALRVVGSSGTTQYAEDIAHTTGDSSVFVSAIRRDTTPSSSAGTAGDYTALNADANGRLYTQAVLYNSSGSELTLANDVVEDAAAAGAESGPMVLSVRRDTAASSAGTDGDFATLNTDASGRLWVNCGTGCAGGTQFAEDAAHTTADVGTVNLAVRRDTAASGTSADGDYATLNVNSVGRLYATATIDAALPTGSNVIGALSANQSTNVAQMNGVTVTMGNGASGTGVQRVSLASDSTGNIATIGTSITPGTAAANLGKAEDAVHASGDTGVAALVRVAATASGSSATAGDYATLNVDALGRLWSRGSNPCEDHARITTAVISTSASGNVEIVALNGSDLIYVCGYSLIAGAATGVSFIRGTGTACATGETALTGAWAFAANGGITQANAGSPQFVVPAGNAFCTKNTGANAIAGHVTYVRTAAP